MTMPLPMTTPLESPLHTVAPHSEIIPPRQVFARFIPALLAVLIACGIALFLSGHRESPGVSSGVWGFVTGLVFSSTILIVRFYGYQQRKFGGASRSASMRLVASLDLKRTQALVEEAIADRNPAHPDANTFTFQAPRKVTPAGRLRIFARLFSRSDAPFELQSDGEKVEIHLEALGSDTAISVRSRSRSSLVLFDFGKNLQTVQRLGEQLSARLASALTFERLELDAARKKFDSAESRLSRLQAQHEAHFLFNTLAHVRLLVDESPQRAASMLDALIPYLRSVASNLAGDDSTLGQELEAVRGYLAVMAIRLGDRLRSSVELPAALAGKAILPASVIPLVENAIKHGIEVSRAGGEVRVSVRVAENKLVIEVADTGAGFKSETGSGSGLANLRARLKTRYGDDAILSLRQNQPTGVVATLTLP